VPNDAKAKSVTMRLYDVLGRRVATVAGDAEAGRHERRLSVTDLSSGVYFLRLQAGERIRTQRVTIVR
jgi:hypothetical protein